MVKFVDINTSFHSSNLNNNVLLNDLNTIKKSLERLFTTDKGSIPFNRDYGTSLKSLLFDNTLDESAVAMFLYMDITQFEPRVSLNPNDIVIRQEDRNTYTLSCNFLVPSLNNISGTMESIISKE